MRLNHDMTNALDFARRYPDKWHTFNQAEPATVAAVERLRDLGLVEVNSYGQFRAVPEARVPASHAAATAAKFHAMAC